MKIIKKGFKILVLVIASFFLALNIKVFVKTGGFIPGGFSGVTLLIQNICKKFFNIEISYSLVNLLFNIFPIYLGFRYIGKQYTINSCIVIILSSIFVDLLPSIPITYDFLLLSVFGGIINGTIMVLCLNNNATTGGTDFISIYFSEKKGISFWNYILVFNVLILLIAGYLFDWDVALYSIIFQFTSTQVVNNFYKRYKQDSLLIVTNKPNDIYKVIKNNTNHTCTLFKGIGLFDEKENDMVYSVINSDATKKILSLIKKTDEHAFINIIKSNSVSGNFYIRKNK